MKGYHTPIEDEDTGDGEEDDDDDVQESMFIEGGMSEIPTDLPGVSVSRGGSFIGSATQVPSPSSAFMTVSLDAYLDPSRISYGSPAEFDAVPRISSPDDTFPVFSPPPSEVILQISRIPVLLQSIHLTIFRIRIEIVINARLIRTCLHHQTQMLD